MMEYISVSSLYHYFRCKRCFWIDQKTGLNIDNNFPKFPLVMDELIKEYFDQYRPKKPPIIKQKLPDVYSMYNKQGVIDKLRSKKIL